MIGFAVYSEACLVLPGIGDCMVLGFMSTCYASSEAIPYPCTALSDSSVLQGRNLDSVWKCDLLVSFPCPQEFLCMTATTMHVVTSFFSCLLAIPQIEKPSMFFRIRQKLKLTMKHSTQVKGFPSACQATQNFPGQKHCLGLHFPWLWPLLHAKYKIKDEKELFLCHICDN